MKHLNFTLKKPTITFLFIGFICLANLSFGQTYTNKSAPVDNPYTTKYPGKEGTGHWTDSINWNNVKNVQNFKVQDNEGNVDWNASYEKAAKAVQDAGGGVVYFPSLGEDQVLGGIKPYIFDTNLVLHNNVVIRGDNPKNLNAKDTLKLGTKFHSLQFNE